MIDEALGSISNDSKADYYIYIKIGEYYFQIVRNMFSDVNKDTHYKISRDIYEGIRSKTSTIRLNENSISIDNCTMNSIISEIRMSKLDKALND